MCGAGWRNNVFKLVKKEVKFVSIMGEKYVGCYKDTGNRDLSDYLSKSTSPTDCYKLATSKGYKYAAMQYGQHCFGSNSYGSMERDQNQSVT
jgi:hypothetical protein